MKRCFLEYSKGLLQRTLFGLEEETTIGRDADNDICLLGEKVSRKHVRLNLQSGQWILHDLESLNGTFVNGERILSQVLNHDDVIRIGDSILRFLVAEEPERKRTLEETGEAFVTDLQQDIEQQMNLVKTFLEALPVGVAIINAKKEVLYCNRALESYRKTNADEQGRLLSDLLDCSTLGQKGANCGSSSACLDCPIGAAVDRAFKAQVQAIDMEVPWHGKSETPPAYIRFSVIPLPYRLTGESLAQLTWEDITFRKRAQDTLQKAHEDLERRVAERTAELQQANEQLQQQVAERKHAEEALRQSEERYRSLVENVPLAVYRATPIPNGTFLMANRSFLNMFGFESIRELRKRKVEDVHLNPAEVKTFSDTLLEKGHVSDVELAMKREDGTHLWGSVTARAFFEEGGEVAFYDCTIMDITARKAAEKDKEALEAQLRQAQKMEAIGTLAGGIAHDFNNLLTGILGNVSLMLIGVDSRNPHYERLKSIEALVRSGSKLTSHLLGYARKGKYEVRPLDLNELVVETSETFGRTRKDIVVHLELGEGVMAIEADQGQIEQVLLNLYVNAADAMVSGGALTLRTGWASHKDIKSKLYTAKPGEYVLLTVTDTGIGMDNETMERIFDPFFTTKEIGTGTGLGLASVYGIVKGHGGYIDVLSKQGKGSTFRIYLPATEKAVLQASREVAKPMGGNETVLLVDDEEIVLEVGVRLLEALGYTVLKARSGKEAIEIYGSQRDNVALVILDMVMPHMRGGDTYERLKGIDPDVKVILSSGYSMDGQAKEILERGCNGFIQKPFRINELSGKIREILDRD